MYILTKYFQQYMRDHGQVDIDEEQFELFFQLFNAFHSLPDNDNLPESSEEVQKFRKDVCCGCSYFKSERGNNTCKMCGCNINQKVKLSTERCPLDKWLIDLKPLKKRFRETIEFLNDKVGTDFYDAETVEEIEEKYKKIIESGERHG